MYSLALRIVFVRVVCRCLAVLLADSKLLSTPVYLPESSDVGFPAGACSTTATCYAGGVLLPGPDDAPRTHADV